MAAETHQSDSVTTEAKNWDGLPPEVLCMIFHHLPVADLLSCSVVSKYWKKAARDVLKRSKECYAHITHFHEDIQDLNASIVSTDLMQMINGLHIQNKAPEFDQSVSAQTQEEFDWYDLENVRLSEETELKLEELKVKLHAVLNTPWRHLHLDLKCPPKQLLAPEDIWLLRALVSATSESLEKLTIGQDGDWKIPSFSKEFLKLKVLETLTTQNLSSPCNASFLTNFAPKLEEITGDFFELEVHHPVDPSILKRLKSIQVSPAKLVPEGEAKEAFQLVSGLHRLDLQLYHYDWSDEEHSDHDIEKWNLFVFPFVLTSLNTLVELRMYTMELYNLFQKTDQLIFPNLKRLSLATHFYVSLENEICALKLLNLAKMCPRLTHLELPDPESSYTQVEQVLAPADVSDELNKSNLRLQIELMCRDRDDHVYYHEYLNFLKDIYPNMNKVKILSWGADDCSQISKIFSDLQSLEYLEVTFWADSTEEQYLHIDALFRGIHIEEAKVAPSFPRKEKDQGNPCIVAIRPSIFNAKCLKELKITEHGLRNTVSRSWVTEITENIPTRNTRNLNVVFEGSLGLYNGLSRLGALPPCSCASRINKTWN